MNPIIRFVKYQKDLDLEQFLYSSLSLRIFECQFALVKRGLVPSHLISPGEGARV